MQAYNCSIEQMDEVLFRVNRKYKGNIEYKNFENKAHYISFTLKVKDANGPGSKTGNINRKSGKPRRTTAACFHVHGDFFDFLLNLEPRAIVYANKLKIHNGLDSDGHIIRPSINNWLDWYDDHDRLASESCDCPDTGKFYRNIEDTL